MFDRIIWVLLKRTLIMPVIHLCISLACIRWHIPKFIPANSWRTAHLPTPFFPPFVSCLCHFLILLQVCLFQATIKLVDDKSSLRFDASSWPPIKKDFPDIRDGPVELELLQIFTRRRPLLMVTLLCLNTSLIRPRIIVLFSSLSMRTTLNLITERYPRNHH